MQLIGHGAQYNVYDTEDGRVLKRPLTQEETIKIITSWYEEGEVPPEKLEVYHTAAAQKACTVMRPHVAKSSELAHLLGNPVFSDGAEYTQDKVDTVGTALQSAPVTEGERIIDSYIQCIIDLWGFGLADRVYNPTINNGLKADKRVILIDFGEVTFEKSDVEKRIAKRRWLKAWSYNHDLPKNLRDYYAEQMKARLTQAQLDETWRKQLAP